MLTRYKETIYRNVGQTHQYIFFKNKRSLNFFLHVLRNNNLYVDTRYCLMTLFINPIGVHHRCHESGAVSRGVSRCHECNVIPVMNVIIRYSYKRHIRDTTNRELGIDIYMKKYRQLQPTIRTLVPRNVYSWQKPKWPINNNYWMSLCQTFFELQHLTQQSLKYSK